jgi:hypothetical protein
VTDVKIHLCDPDGAGIYFESHSLETARSMVRSLIKAGYKPVAEPSSPAVGPPCAETLRDLGQQLEALHELVDGLQARDRAVSGSLPSEPLAPLAASVAQLTDRLQHVEAQLAAVAHRLDATLDLLSRAMAERLAAQCLPPAPVLPPASVPVATSNGVQRVPRPTAPVQASSPPRERILAYLCAVGPKRPSEVDTALGLPKSRDVLRRLAAASLVTRQPDGCYAVAADGH